MKTNDYHKQNDPVVFYLLELSQAEWNLSHFPFPWVWPVSRCPSPMSVLWKHLWSQQNNKLEWCFEGLLNIQAQYKMYMRFFSPKIMLNAVPVTGCATVETAGLSKAIEWTLWQSQTITSMQAEVEEQEWMHRPGEGQGLIVDLALVQHGLAMDGRTYGRSTLFFRIEQYLDPLLMLLLLHPNQDL